MALQVPLQTAPSVPLEAGSEVQYGATNVQPGKDVVTDDIARLSKAQSELGLTLNKLDNELSDAEAKRLANDYATDLNALGNEYSNLKGVNAVGTVTVGDKQVPIFEQYQSRAKALHDSYAEKASSGTVRSIFGSKSSVYTRSFIDTITRHSLKEQRDYNENETLKERDIHKEAAKINFESWNDPNGLFRKSYAIGVTKIQEYAVLMGWNIDPEAVDAQGKKIGISHRYLEALEEYNMEILKAVVKGLKDKGDFDGAKNFLRSLDPNGDSKEIQEAVKVVTAAQIENGNSKCVAAIISNNGDQNNGRFSSQFDALQCLKSNNFHDNGIGGSVVDGNNSNEIDITDRKQSENRETLDQRRSTSKFFSSESSLKGTLIPQHQTTHLFAIQKLGVEKADSLYTKAKSSVDYDKERFKNDPEYAIEINKQIIGNYNKLIIEAAKKRYGNKEIPKIENQLKEARSQTGTGRSFQNNKRDKIAKLEAALDKARADDPKYVDIIENDLNIITNGIDYNFSSEEETIEINPITGLQPIEVLKAKLKDRITDPKELKTALKDLEIKYNKIKTEREAAYKEAFEKAQEIAFADKGGWENLAAHGIDINDFTKEDQEILRNGPPEESDKGTLVKLEKNPTEVRDNLPAYRPKLSATQFLELTQYADSLKADPGSVLAVTVDNDMLDLSLKTFKFDRIRKQENDQAKDDYLQIKGRWKQLIDEEQTRTGGKITRERKRELLHQVLSNTVMYDPGHGSWPWQPHGDDYSIPVSAVVEDAERAYVWVRGEKVMYSAINQFQRERIIAEIEAQGEVPTERRIADMWVYGGKSKIDNEDDWEKYEENLEKEKTSTSSMK